jgi:RNA polymerase sigma-70 factor, ECF subfamily
MIKMNARISGYDPTGRMKSMLFHQTSATSSSRSSIEINREREARFLQLFLANERRIYSYILALVPVWSDADDVLQETSAVMWRKLDEFEVGSDFLAWALSIARFEVLNHRKKQGRARVHFSDEAVTLLADGITSRREDSDIRLAALDACVEKLGQRERELIRLRYQPGAKVQEIADRLGRSLQAVYKSLDKIHTQLLLCVRRSLAAEDAR